MIKNKASPENACKSLWIADQVLAFQRGSATTDLLNNV
jgi:hypothetical protein